MGLFARSRRLPPIRTAAGRSLTTRHMLFESLEDRRLLAADASVFYDEIRVAFERAADLDQYTADQVATATQWVVRLDGTATVQQVANQLGVPKLAPAGRIPLTYIYQVPSSDAGNGPPDLSAVAIELDDVAGIDAFYPLVARRQLGRRIPNDPMYGAQWHLHNTGQTGGTVGADANVELAWDQVLGAGVTVGVIDTGLESTHGDLVGNYQAGLSFDFNNNDSNPDDCDGHGTSVAGVAAAKGDNALGISGAAPGAALAGLKLICAATTDQQEASALAHQLQSIDIYNNSWGPADAAAWLAAPGPLTIAALQDGVQNGRAGLGSIYVWAGGNGNSGQDDVNYDGYANSRYTIAVGAIDHNGVQSPYSEPGAALLVSAYSNGAAGAGITTTALNNGYTSSFGGTSSAAPLVSGVIALMLEANQSLSWRDVQHVLVNSARTTDVNDSGWSTNAAGHAFNHKYGFGAIDAEEAVKLARSWQNVAPEQTASGPRITVAAAIPDNNATGLSSKTTISRDMLVESADVLFSSQHTAWDNLEVTLVSPSGTRAVLARPHASGSPAQYSNWRFNATTFWDESAVGDWTLEVKDLVSGDSGTFDSWQLILHGRQPQAPPPDDPGTESPFIAGRKFSDLNGNGVFDNGEPPLARVAIYIDLDQDGRLDFGEPTALTNAKGQYQIAFSTPGDYQVREVVPAGWVQTLPGGNGAHEITIGPDIKNLDVNFGNQANNDYGDAPESYGSASAGIMAGVHLGALVDGEGIEQPSADGKGDDDNGLDDEDGVKFVNQIFAGQTGTIDVTVSTGGISPAAFQGWIDFNGDGDFNDAGEQIFKDRVLKQGKHTLTFPVPNNTKVGNTFARFRYSYERGIGPAGHARAGEVEDYQVLVLADIPVANDDRFIVQQNSTNNVFDVLVNDFPSSSGPLTITNVGITNQGGFVTIAPNGRSLFYAPAANFFSPPTETFTYTVGDGTGKTDTASITVTVNPIFTNPIAVDDVARVSAASQNNVINVLANDVAGTDGPLTLVTVTQPSSGSARIDTRGTPNPSDDVVVYTPGANFADVDQFNYTVSNVNGVLGTGTVTVFEQPAAVNNDVEFVLETLDLQGNLITSIDVGQSFKLRVSVQDTRAFPLAPGVAAAYLDVLYPRNLVSVVPDAANPLNFQVDFSDEYDQAIAGNAQIAGLIDDVGAFQDGFAPLGIDVLEVFSVTMRANAAGNVEFLSDPADAQPAHDVLLFDPPERVALARIGYGFTSLQINGPGRDNGDPPGNEDPGDPNPLDVNRDGRVTPFDALQVINGLNQGGPRDVNSPLDVNGDQRLSPIDALLVINALNAQANGEGEASQPLPSRSQPQPLPLLDKDAASDTQRPDAAESADRLTTPLNQVTVDRIWTGHARPTIRFDNGRLTRHVADAIDELLDDLLS